MSRIWKYIGLACCAAAVAWGCAEEIEVPGTGDGGEQEKEYRTAEVSLSLSVAPVEAGYGAEAKAGGGLETKAPTEVTKFWFIEYDSGGYIIAPPKYYDMSSAEGGRIAVAVPYEGSGEKFTGVVIAATKGDMNTAEHQARLTRESCMTLDRLYALCSTRTLDQVYRVGTSHEEPDIILYGSFDIDENIVAGASGAAGSTLGCELKRNVVRLSFKVANNAVKADNTPDSDFRIKTVRVGNAPRHFHYFVSPWYIDPKAYVDYDVNLDGAAGTELAPIEHGDSRVFTFYIPQNMKDPVGDASGATVKTKNYFADGNATFVEVTGYAGNDELYHFRFYPGADMESDFRLVTNKKYNLNINIRRYNSLSDSRIGRYQRIDSDAANSYIINPTENRVMYGIPLSWMSEYWTSHASSPSAVAEGEKLIAEVIWQEQDSRAIYFSDAQGFNVKDSFEFSFSSVKSSFYVLTDGRKPGNVLVGVKRASVMTDADPDNDYTSYLWSWHLWITDYNPDEIAAKYPTWTENKYIYNIGDTDDGKAVHRYADGSGSSVWTTEYLNEYIMDRNLGAMSATRTDGLIKTVGLYYQWGRKDPFPNGKKPLYAVDGESAVKYTPAVGDVIATEFSKTTIDGAVNKPHTNFVQSDGTWMLANGYEGNPWHSLVDSNEKSIFDPCPAGWKVPQKGTWDYFIKNGVRNFVSSESDGGAEFIIGDSNGEDSAMAFYPTTGTRSYNNEGSLSDSYLTYGFNWSATPGSSGNASRMFFSQSGFILNEYFRVLAQPVRCVQDM